MRKVTVIGLGLMGSALAEAFLKKPLAVTVWNRSAARTERLKAQGAQVAATVEEAIAASDVVIVSLSNYSAAREVLGGEAASRALKGKTLIQLSSGTTKEGRDAAEWAQEHGVKYLDGAILAYPQHIGSAAAQILLSGSDEILRQQKELLEVLGTPLFVSKSPGGAAALDCAVLIGSMCSMMSLFYGIAVCESEGVASEHVVSLVNAFLPLHGVLNIEMAERIRKDNFANPQATVRTWAGVAKHFVEIAHENGLPGDVPDMIGGVMERALRKGLGELEISSLIKVMRAKQSH
jgi:3-hydroxyisobutyrate dehydrogenase-like beta-hydroxyacid dehydrogenase